MKKINILLFQYIVFPFIIISCHSKFENDTSKDLKDEKLEVVDCSDFNYKEKEQIIGDFEDLIRKDSITRLSIQGISFKWEFGNYPFLKSFELKDCQAPLSFNFLKNSKCISSINLERCSDVASMEIPFKSLTNLTSLTIYDCQKIPNKIFECSSLEILKLEDLSETSLVALNFDNLIKLQNLKVLEINRVYYKGEDVMNNNLKWKVIGQLQNLEILTLNKVRLDHIGDEIGQCKKIQSLTFYNNGIGHIGSGLCQLGKLKELSIQNNPILKLPDCFGELTELESLFLNSDSIQELPASFVNLDKLKFLSMSNSNLSAFPKEVMKLKGIEEFLILSDKFKVNDSLYKELNSAFKGRKVSYDIDESTYYREED